MVAQVLALALTPPSTPIWFEPSLPISARLRSKPSVLIQVPIPISAPPPARPIVTFALTHRQPDSLCNPFSAPFPHPDPNHYSNQSLNLTPTPPRKTFSLNPLQESSTITLNPTPNYIPTLSPTANSHLPMFTGNTNSTLIQVPTRVSFLRSTSTSPLTLLPIPICQRLNLPLIPPAIPPQLSFPTLIPNII